MIDRISQHYGHILELLQLLQTFLTMSPRSERAIEKFKKKRACVLLQRRMEIEWKRARKLNSSQTYLHNLFTESGFVMRYMMIGRNEIHSHW